MPLLGLRGSVTARGYGLFNKRPLIFKTTTIPAFTTTNWTTPPDVTNLVLVSGKGGPGGLGTWRYDVVPNITPPNTDTGWTDYSSFYSFWQGRLATINNNISTSGYVTNVGTLYIDFKSSTSTLWTAQNGSAVNNAYGTATLNWTYPTSGTITNSINTTYNAANIIIPYYATGSSSTAFGLTFFGRTGPGDATLTTYNNVAVNSNTTYSIVNNSSTTVITIQYYTAY